MGSLFLLQVSGDKLLRAHYADLPRLAHTRAMAAFAPALTPMLATPPARVFAATNMLPSYYINLPSHGGCRWPLTK